MKDLIVSGVDPSVITQYDTINGTSMATPYVAGLAAMIRAYNPDYTYEDVVESIKNGGDTEASLKYKTSTGKAADAFGSLKYISPPKNATVTVL